MAIAIMIAMWSIHIAKFDTYIGKPSKALSERWATEMKIGGR